MKFGLRRTPVLTLKLRTSDKFGLRTSSDQSELFAPLTRKLRTGPDWEVRTSDWSPNFRPADKKTSDRTGLGKFGQVRTSDYSPNFCTAKNFGLDRTVVFPLEFKAFLAFSEF